MGMLGVAGRLFFSFIAISIFGTALSMVIHIHEMFVASEEAVRHPPSVHLGSPFAPAAAPVETFWPEYPHDTPGASQSSMINGVQVITEEWTCGASPDDILEYYRGQMAARGWVDTTRQTYTLAPEMRATPEDLENQKYISSYHDVTDSTLMLNRGDWTLRISVEPAKTGFQQTTVRFYAAQALSIMQVAESTMPAVLAKKGQRSPLDVIQKSDTEKYHTTITTSEKGSRDAFREALAGAISQGWRPMLFRQVPRGYFVWLTKGRQYAALSTQDLEGGGGSSVTFVEVKPN